MFDLSNKTSSKFFDVTPNWYQEKFMRNTITRRLEWMSNDSQWMMDGRSRWIQWLNEWDLPAPDHVDHAIWKPLSCSTHLQPQQICHSKSWHSEWDGMHRTCVFEPSYANRNLMIQDGTSLEQTTLFISLKKLSTWTTLTDSPGCSQNQINYSKKKPYWFVRCSGAYEPLPSTSTQCIFHWKPHEWCKFPSKAH